LLNIFTLSFFSFEGVLDLIENASRKGPELRLLSTQLTSPPHNGPESLALVLKMESKMLSRLSSPLLA
jgi:hypothetical protein